MISEVRDGILAVDGAINDANEDFSSTDDRFDGASLSSTVIHINHATSNATSTAADDQSAASRAKSEQESRNDYNVGVLKYVQAIFGHLAASKLQYYIPRGFWKHFKLWGEPVNLREQHDALEFFNSLVDSLDEALKSLHQTPVMSRVLGGSFADQKICKDCPHRFVVEMFLLL